MKKVVCLLIFFMSSMIFAVGSEFKTLSFNEIKYEEMLTLIDDLDSEMDDCSRLFTDENGKTPSENIKEIVENLGFEQFKRRYPQTIYLGILEYQRFMQREIDNLKSKARQIRGVSKEAILYRIKLMEYVKKISSCLELTPAELEKIQTVEEYIKIFVDYEKRASKGLKNIISLEKKRYEKTLYNGALGVKKKKNGWLRRALRLTKDILRHPTRHFGPKRVLRQQMRKGIQILSKVPFVGKKMARKALKNKRVYKTARQAQMEYHDFHYGMNEETVGFNFGELATEI